MPWKLSIMIKIQIIKIILKIKMNHCNNKKNLFQEKAIGSAQMLLVKT